MFCPAVLVIIGSKLATDILDLSKKTIYNVKLNYKWVFDV